MHSSGIHRALGLGTAAALAITLAPAGLAAAEPPPDTAHSAQLEFLDRGLVALATEEGVFLSWRLLGDEIDGATPDGLTGVDFNVYRDGEVIASVTNSTNYLDEASDGTGEYHVVAVRDGVELEASGTISPASGGHLSLPLQRPEGGTTPAGEDYTYSANDMSVGDVDGDGQYEFFVKWDPSNSKDVSQVGYTGNVYLDAYRLDGTLLWRIDMGVNIRAGAHYTQFNVFDLDGDGVAEVMMKTAPGTHTITDGEQHFITMPQEDLDAGYSHDDDYRMSAEDYHAHLVQMFMGWSEHPEVVAGNWPATLEEAFGIEARHEYPLDEAAATDLVDHFIDVYAPSRSGRNQLRNFEGFILEGPEYLTVFDGRTGTELETIHYPVPRHDDGLMWGDYAMSRIEPGNRVDRFLSGVAYLDGTTPAAIFARGYYTRTTLNAYTWDGESLTEVWDIDSGWTPMANPFNAGPHGVDGTDPVYGSITTQGFHSLSVADVDGDETQEIIYGSATFNSDGSLRYSSFDDMPEGSADPGTYTRLGHGDAMHVGNFDPSREGLEIFTVHEGGAWAPYGYAMRDANTGEVLWGGYTGRDTGRGMVGDVDPDVAGVEAWAVDLRSADGDVLGTARPGTNMSIRWAGDGTTQLVNGSQDQDVTIDDWQRGRLLLAEGARTNNYTKGNPSLVADVLGDWREELLVRDTQSSEIRIYVSTELTDIKLHTLMHDPQYRVDVARQQTTYNQPAYTSFYLASDMDFSDIAIPEAPEPPGEVSVFSAGVKLVGSGTNVWGRADGFVGEPVVAEVLVGDGWVEVGSSVVADGGSYVVALSGDEVAAKGEYLVRVRVGETVSEEVAFERVARTGFGAAHFAPVGRTANVWGTVDGGQARVSTQVFVPGRGWSTSQVGASDASGWFVVPLTYGAGSAGEYRWRVVVDHAHGEREVTREFVQTRVAVPSAHSAGSAPVGVGANVWGSTGSASAVVWTEVYLGDGRWSKSQQTVSDASGGYVLPLTYGNDVAGSYRFRVASLHPVLGVMYSEPFTFVRTARGFTSIR